MGNSSGLPYSLRSSKQEGTQANRLPDWVRSFYCSPYSHPTEIYWNHTHSWIYRHLPMDWGHTDLKLQAFKYTWIWVSISLWSPKSSLLHGLKLYVDLHSRWGTCLFPLLYQPTLCCLVAWFCYGPTLSAHSLQACITEEHLWHRGHVNS